MAKKLDWTRTSEGRGGYDAATGIEWRNGPSQFDLERPDGSDHLKLHEPPTMYWAAELRKAFPAENEAAHLALFDLAWKTARDMYWGRGFSFCKGRAKAIFERSSKRTPFPSAFYAAYFDWCIYHVAKRDHERRGIPLPKVIARYNNWEGEPLCVRARQANPPWGDALGVKGYYTHMKNLEDEVWQMRSTIKEALNADASPSSP